MPLFEEDLQLANFAGMKVPTIFIRKTFKGSKQLKELEVMCSNAIYVYISLYSKILCFR